MNNWETTELFKRIANGYTDTEIKNQVKHLIFDEMKEKIVRQAAYNYDYSTLLPTNLEKSDKEFLKKYIFTNRIKNKLQKVVRSASEHGISGILSRIGEKNVISQNIFILNNPIYHNEVLVSVDLTVDYVDLDAYDEQDLNTMKLWLNESGNYVLSHMRYSLNENGDAFDFENGEVIIIKNADGEEYTKEYVYSDFDGCPLEILENNESARGDWTYAKESIRLFAKFDSLIEQEWEWIKVQLINNLLLNPDKEGKQIQKDIENGDTRVHDQISDANGLGGSSLQTLSAGGVTVDIARIIKENYKEEVKELTMAIGSLAGGNNKHTSEAILSNFDGFKYLFVKKEYFEDFVAKLFAKTLDYSKAFDNSIVYDGKMIETKIKFSRVIELLLAEAEGAVKPKQPNTPQPKNNKEPA